MNRPPAVLCWPRHRPDAKLTVVCLSYCGGGTMPFRPWASVLSGTIQLALVCYPGRELRWAEEPAADWESLLRDTVEAVHGLTAGPYVLFGHSMGARVAFEAAAQLQRSGVRPPEALVVSGAEPPTDWRASRQRPPTVHDTDAELLAWLTTAGQLAPEVVDESELCELALALMRADLAANDSYHYTGSTVGVAIEVLFGTDDEDMSLPTARGWADLTTGRCTVAELPGGHFYTEPVWASLPLSIEALRDYL